ncbi:protocadherin alpha-8-like isoform X32 [Corythoichthys intestinalis]|uniref:protocadherin alpha-8-like isoform X32 n=1 Tax=Corythoichthys intestinalis TaxID=161448 RepID=UPI0025A5A25D|nr:protocadherin alpha-8-like isoform X32 [Corythoichthys intestinalis]
MFWIRPVLFILLLCSGELVFGQLKYSTPEEVKVGSIVGNVAKDLGLDVSTLTSRRFRIVSGAQDVLFEVNPNNGLLFVHKHLDREELCDRNAVCVMDLKIVVENPLEIHYVSVDVIDSNDHAPSFTERGTVIEIAENTLSGARFQLQGARDPDIGINSIQRYKLSHSDHFQLEIRDRGEDKIPFLVLQKQLDREEKINHSLILSAIDGGTPSKSANLNVTIRVLDINDNRPIFSKEVYSVELPENSVFGTSVIKVQATDLDEGANGEVEYEFRGHMNSEVIHLFSLDKILGEIRVKGEIDFETNHVFKLDVQASDKGQPPMTTDCRVIIKIQDVNDNKPEIEVTSITSIVPEDAKHGTVIALISVTDIDSGPNGKVICTLTGNVPLELKPSFKENMYSLVTKDTLDREKISNYDISITATDCGEPPLSTFKTVSIQVKDVNDNIPEFPQNPLELYLTENNEPGTSVFSVSAFDKDLDDNAAISYYIVRQGGHTDITSFLNINPENGQISALKSFDFETVKSFHFQVVATDGGSPPLSSNVTVKVYILDQNDNTPVILYPVSSNGSAEGVVEIPRNMKIGDLVTKVRAYDADIGYNGWLLFSFGQVTDHSLFSLDRYTGQIRTLRSLTEMDEAEHRLLILVKDNGNVSLSATATVIVKLVEPKEAFAASDVKSATKVDQEEDNMTFYLIITLGSVSLLFVISIIVLIAMQCSKSTEYTSKYLQDTNYDGTLCHSIQYRSGDKRYMLVGPRMSIGSTIVPGSHANTLVLPDRRNTSGEPKAPNSDWRYSASLRAGGVMQSSVHMEESSVMQGAQGVLVQNWPTASSAADAEGGEVSPPMGAGVDSNSWHFRYGPGGPGAPPQHLKAGEVPPEAFIIPGSPAIISIRQNQGGEDDKSDFITFGKKEEAKKKKKKKKDKKDKKDKGKDDDE